MIEIRCRIQRGTFTLELDLRIPDQGVTAILGPSGCGKTSLLRAVAGLDKDPQGRIVMGPDVWQDEERCLPTHLRPLGYVFQESNLFPHLSVEQNLLYARDRVVEDPPRIGWDDAIGLLSLNEMLSRDPSSLSGGERQRVALARALLTSPRLLLLDEPLASLDEASKGEILPYLEKVHRALEIPVLYVSHSLDEVIRLADHLVLLESGRSIGMGPLGELLTRADLPLAHRDDAEAVVEATVTGHDDRYHLTYLKAEGGEFTVARNTLAEGQAVRLRILARDVSIALEKPERTSILNSFPARIESMLEESQAQLTLRLRLANSVILARITRKSAASLELVEGKEVYAQVKSVALFAD